ncbi:hypothetical protein ACFVR1_16180 [Psychrobacillus sp. NPDC058041]|uniref:hypothetical protein n=1 Tax=Psychrobacillus sp. NPDC058041 TaxID=3346310 RepID=UPI0036D9E267
MKKKNKVYLILIIAGIAFFSFKYWNDYRERALDDLIRLKKSDFIGFSFTNSVVPIPDEQADGWRTEDLEPVDELLNFLSQYRVKRQRENFFDPNYEGKRFSFTIHHGKSNPTMVTVEEDYVHIYSGDYYKVVNGPIDTDWLNAYYEKYKKMYNE